MAILTQQAMTDEMRELFEEEMKKAHVEQDSNRLEDLYKLYEEMERQKISPHQAMNMYPSSMGTQPIMSVGSNGTMSAKDPYANLDLVFAVTAPQTLSDHFGLPMSRNSTNNQQWLDEANVMWGSDVLQIWANHHTYSKSYNGRVKRAVLATVLLHLPDEEVKPEKKTKSVKRQKIEDDEEQPF